MGRIQDSLNCLGSHNLQGSNNLERELLSLGGKYVHDLGIRAVARNLPMFTWYSARHGEPDVTGTALVQVAVRYALHRDVDIGIGYALDADDLWQEHAWIIEGPGPGWVTDTSGVLRKMYWGARLRTFSECREFCYSVGVTCK